MPEHEYIDWNAEHFRPVESSINPLGLPSNR